MSLNPDGTVNLDAIDPAQAIVDCGQISEDLGWGRNRERARAAIERAVSDGRLVKRGYMRDGQEIAQRCAYVVCAGGRRFTDEELVIVKEPILLPSSATGGDE